MKSTEHSAKKILGLYKIDRISQILNTLNGREAECLISMIKVADLHTQFSVHELPGYGKFSADEGRKILEGIAQLLPKILLKAGGANFAIDTNRLDIPMLKQSREILNEVGTIAGVERLAAGEEKNLIECRVKSPTDIAIKLIGPDLEAGENASLNELLDLAKAEMASELENVHSAYRDRIVELYSSGFTLLPKDALHGLSDVGRKYLEMHRGEYAEADAFGNDTRLGPLRFSEWKAIAESICAEGFARACIEDCNLDRTGDFSPIRFLLMPPTSISSEEVGLCIERVLPSVNSKLHEEIKSCLILKCTDYDVSCDGSNYLYPLLMEIDGTLIMPRYSRIANPYLFLLSRLMRNYQDDLPAARDQREAPFQADLHKIFNDESYVIAASNAMLKKDNGDDLTDIDAAIYEKASNCVYLFQLFWPDIQAGDIKRNRKQYKRLRNKTKWLYDVTEWGGRNSSGDLLEYLELNDYGIDTTTLQVKYIMLTRSWANFSGSKPYDITGAWLSWSYFQLLLKKAEDPKIALAYAYAEARKNLQQSRSPTGREARYQFGDILVSVTV